MAGDEAFNIGRVIHRTAGLLYRNWALFSVLAALFSGVPNLALMLVLPGLLSSVGGAGYDQASAISIGLGAVYLLGAMVLQAALTRASVDELAGNRVSFAAALRAGLAALLPMLGLLLFVVFLFVVAVFSFAIIGGIASLGAGYVVVLLFAIVVVAVFLYLIVRWIAVVPVLVVERPGVIQSLRRSSALTADHRWAVFGLVILYAVALVVLQTVLQAVLPVVEIQLTRAPTGWVIAGVELLVQIATSLIVAVGIAATYFELRQIKDGVGVDEIAQVFA